MDIEIVWEGGSGMDENVEDYWYDGNDLIVLYEDESKETYPFGNVVTENGEDVDTLTQ